jgi:hypothetical protein
MSGDGVSPPLPVKPRTQHTAQPSYLKSLTVTGAEIQLDPSPNEPADVLEIFDTKSPKVFTNYSSSLV